MLWLIFKVWIAVPFSYVILACPSIYCIISLSLEYSIIIIIIICSGSIKFMSGESWHDVIMTCTSKKLYKPLHLFLSMSTWLCYVGWRDSSLSCFTHNLVLGDRIFFLIWSPGPVFIWVKSFLTDQFDPYLEILQSQLNTSGSVRKNLVQIKTGPGDQIKKKYGPPGLNLCEEYISHGHEVHQAMH